MLDASPLCGFGRCSFFFDEGPVSLGVVSWANVPGFLDTWLFTFLAEPGDLADGAGLVVLGGGIPA